MGGFEVFAHRGSSWDHPENTLAAFEAALAEGATGIETDLRLSRDGVLVLAHDEDLSRVAGDPRRVADLAWDELRAVPLGRGQRVPALAELWELAAGRARLNLELKGPGTGQALARFLEGRRAEVLVTSFHAAELEALRAACPRVPAGPVLERLGRRERERLRRRGYAAVSLAVRGFAEPQIAFCRELGAELLLWVVNEPERVLDFRRLGVDGVFTDCPGRVLPVLRHPSPPGGRRVP